MFWGRWKDRVERGLGLGAGEISGSRVYIVRNFGVPARIAADGRPEQGRHTGPNRHTLQIPCRHTCIGVAGKRMVTNSSCKSVHVKGSPHTPQQCTATTNANLQHS